MKQNRSIFFLVEEQYLKPRHYSHAKDALKRLHSHEESWSESTTKIFNDLFKETEPSWDLIFTVSESFIYFLD